MPTNQEMYDIRLKRMNDAIALKEPDTMPMAPFAASAPFWLYDIGANYKNMFYDFEKANKAFYLFHEEFEPDTGFAPMHMSGRANEIAQTTIMDWPGRPGTPVADTSSHQIYEIEYLKRDEYDELINDYTNFMIHKYIPRAFPGLAGFEKVGFNPSSIMGTSSFAPMFNDEVKQAMRNFIEMIEETEKCDAATAEANKTLAEMGFPPFFTGLAEVPFDVVGDYFRATLGILYDILECPDKVDKASELFIEKQTEHWGYFDYVPIKRMFIPMHKGMDSFMGAKDYEELYWKHFQTLLQWLIDHGITPYLYTEGPYDTRIEFIRDKLLEFPPASCFIHFEEGDFAHIKKRFEGIACVTGGMPLHLLEYGKREQVVERMKYLIQNCAAGGGYICMGSAGLENVKRENLEAMFEVGRDLGKK